MRMLVETLLFEFNSWANKAEMLNYLVKQAKRHIILGQDQEYTHEYFSVRVSNQRTFEVNAVIGICSTMSGSYPSLAPLIHSNQIVVGYNSEICMINLSDFSIKKVMTLDSFFVDFTLMMELDWLLCQHEIGLLMLSTSGEIIWSFAKDVITMLRFHGNEIHLAFMDSAPCRVSLTSGLEIPM